MKRERVGFFILALVCSLSACGGGGGSAPSVPPTPLSTPTPTPTPTLPPAPGVSPASVNLIGAGSTQSVAIDEPGYTGSITIDASKCNGVASASSASVQGPSATFIVTAAQQGGSCAITLTNSFGQTQSLPVTVTITQGVIQ